MILKTTNNSKINIGEANFFVTFVDKILNKCVFFVVCMEFIQKSKNKLYELRE